MPTAVIIDDIRKARDLLRRDLNSFCPDIEVIGEAEGVVSGLKLLKQNDPDIVFLDINMADGTGFDLLELVNKPTFKLIFTTASDAYAIRAFKFSAIDYLLKPIDSEELMQAVKTALSQNTQQNSQAMDLLKDQIKESKEMQKLALHTSDKIYICELKSIIRCESNVNYTQFFFDDGHKLLVTKTLKFYDQLLSQSGFCRVHQSHLINLGHIKEYVKSDGGYIVMNDGTSVPISARKKSEVVNLISDIH